MTTTGRFIVALGGALLVASQASCDDLFKCFDVSTPTPMMKRPAGAMWVGDTLWLHATKWADCERPVDSREVWSAFTFVSTDTNVAVVSEQGVVTARKPGRSYIYVDGLRSEALVSDPVSTVNVTFAPASPKVGDTASVTFQAIRADGQPAAGATLVNTIRIQRASGEASWAFLNGATPAVAKFVAAEAATYQVTSTATRESGAPAVTIAKVVVP